MSRVLFPGAFIFGLVIVFHDTVSMSTALFPFSCVDILVLVCDFYLSGGHLLAIFEVAFIFGATCVPIPITRLSEDSFAMRFDDLSISEIFTGVVEALKMSCYID